MELQHEIAPLTSDNTIPHLPHFPVKNFFSPLSLIANSMNYQDVDDSDVNSVSSIELTRNSPTKDALDNNTDAPSISFTDHEILSDGDLTYNDTSQAHSVKPATKIDTPVPKINADKSEIPSNASVANKSEPLPPRVKNKTKSKKASKKGPYCLQSCKFDGLESKQPMIRCCMCMQYYHDKCIDDTEDEINASSIWHCAICRELPSLIKNELIAVRKTNTDLVSLLAARTGECEILREQLASIRQDPNSRPYCNCDDLKNQNHVLIQTNANLVIEISKLTEDIRSLKEIKHKVNDNQSNKSKNLLIGSSIIRDIHRQALPNYDVICISGATISDVHNKLSKCDSKYMNITLVVGGNDCSKQENTDLIISKYKALISLAKEKAENKVFISSICPRLSDATVQSRIESVNAALMLDADLTNINFVNNDLTFRLQDNSINDGYYLPDGVHLSSAGTTKLAKNLNLVPVSGKNIVWQKKVFNNTNRLREQSKPALGSPGLPPNPINSEAKESFRASYNPHSYQSYKQKYNSSICPNYNLNKQNMTYNNYSNHTSTYQEQAYPQSQSKLIYCWNCGESGHVTLNCRFGQPVRCIKCNKYGHKYKFCSLYND